MRQHSDLHRGLFVAAGLLLPALALALSWGSVRTAASAAAGALSGPDGGRAAAGAAGAAALVLAGHVLRAARTKVVLDSVRRGTLAGQFQALAVGYLFGMALPLRLGELARAYIVSRKLRISLAYTVLAVALERIIDVVLVSTAFLALAPLLPRGATAGSWAAAAAALVVAVALLVLVVRFVREDRLLIRLAWRTTGWLNPALEGRARFTLWSVIFGFQRFLLERPRLVRYGALTAASWACYALAGLVLARALLPGAGAVRQVAAAATPYAVASPALGPSLPGSFLTGTRAFLDGVLPGDGVGVLAYAAVAYAVLTAPVVVAGALSLLLLVRPWRKPAPQAPLRGSYANKLERDEDISASLPSFLESYFQRDRLSRVLHRLELAGDTTLVRFFKGGSNAVTVLAARGDDVHVTKIVPPEHAHRLKDQHDWLAARASMPQLVTVLREETGEEHYSIDLEYRRDSVPLFEYVHSHPLEQSAARLEEVWRWITSDVYRLHPAAAHRAERDAYVEDRFVRRVRAAAEQHEGLKHALDADRIVVNGRELDGFDVLVDRIRSHPRAWEELALYQTSDAIHGDLTVDNILVDLARGEHGEALVIDPSDDNEVRGPVVDFARHLQSLRFGYEFLNEDDEVVLLDRTASGLPSISFADLRSARYAQLHEHVTTHVMTRHLTAVEQRTVLFHVGLFYGRMLTHRVVINPGTALKYLGTSVLALHAFLDQYDALDA